MSRNLTILHIMPSVGPKSFGLGPVALNLALEQLRLGCNVRIWTHDTREDADWASENSGFPADLIRLFPTFGPHHLGYSPALERAIVGADGRSMDVVHQHGMWTAVSRATSVWRRATAGPTCIVPHGSLQAWCLKRSVLKKKIAMWGYENRNLAAASCIHALTQREVDECRAFGLRSPAAVINNGISQSWLDTRGDGGRFRDRYRIPDDRRIALFVGRISPVKGLPMLLQALRALRSEVRQWSFLLAGSDEFNHQAECERLVAEYDLGSIVRFVGPLFGPIKADAFAAADLFLLPSLTEAAPVVVLEALGMGVPVITTKGAPWQDVETYRCGWWTDISPEGIAQAIHDAFGKTQEELTAMGKNGIQLVSEHYTWRQSAEKTVKLYNWLIGRSSQPDFVYTE